MARYEELMRQNIADAVQAMRLKMDYDGTVTIPYALELDNNWIEQGIDPERNCLLWLNIFFEHFRVIHPGCMSCWKIFYKPATLRELYEIYDLQKKGIWKGIVPSCKCGIENRPYSGNLGGYAAFWYNPLGCGLRKARENLKKLRKIFGKDLQLKRGCTEMEQFTVSHLGMDSSRWNELIPAAKKKLEMLERTFRVDDSYKRYNRPMPVKVKTEAAWIRHAAHHGDLTYLSYVEKALIPSLHMYRNSIDRERDIDDGYIWKQYSKSKSGSKSGGSRDDGKQEEAIFTEL